MISGLGSFSHVIAAALASQTTWKIPAAVTLAQWAIESNFGRSMPNGSNNPFGIKAAGGQSYVEAHTHEVVNGKTISIVAKFRKFASIYDAFDEHRRLLATATPFAPHPGERPRRARRRLDRSLCHRPNYGTVLKRTMKS